jgi:hypothetical protein
MKEYVGAEVLLLSRVIKADSVAFAYGGRNPMWAAWWLKTLGKTVHLNDLSAFNYWDAVGMVENSGDRFSKKQILDLTEGFKPKVDKVTNPELTRLVPRSDVHFFEQLRNRIDDLPPSLKGMALRAGYQTIRYVQVLDTSASYQALRQPLAMVFHNLLKLQNVRIHEDGEGHAHRQEAREFVKKPRAEALFLQLPTPEGLNLEQFKGERVLGPVGREIWTSGPAKTWLPTLREAVKGTFGDKLITQEAYDQALTVLLDYAKDYPVWVFNLQESDYVKVLSVVKNFRKPKAVHRFDARGGVGGYMNLFLVA